MKPSPWQCGFLALEAASFIALGCFGFFKGPELPGGSRWPAMSGLPAILPLAALLRGRARADRRSVAASLSADGVLIGRGFEWTARHAQDLVEAAARGEAPGDHLARAQSGSEDLALPLPLLAQHLLILGTTGVGKTRLLELLAAQAIRRGDATAVIDPKGDDRLLARIADECRRAGRPLSIFSPFHPKASVSYNPLASFVEPREIADRVAALLPGGGDAEPFRNFGWELVNVTASALHRLGRGVDLVSLKRYGLDDPWALLREWAPKEAGPERLAAKARRSGLPELEALAALASRPRDHSLKMASSLLPVLARLTAGVHRALLSPAKADFGWRDFDRGRGVVYFHLGALLGADSASSIARLALLDLQSHVGMRYAFGLGGGPISLFIDELADVATPAFIHVLNKGRGAGLRIAAAVQTQSDLAAALGSPDRAEQILGNVNTVVQFRAQSAADAELFSAQVGERLLPSTTEGEAYEPALFSSGLRPVDDFRAVFSRQRTWTSTPAVPPWAVMQLPPYHFFARWGARVVKGAAPLLPDVPVASVEEMKDEARAGLPGVAGADLGLGLEFPR